MTKKILITGVNGLLGGRLATILSNKGFDVTGLTRQLYHKNDKQSAQYCFVDFSSDWEIKELPKQCDVVIHLAQSTNFRNFPDSAMDVFKVNIESTARLLDYAKKSGVSKFIYASSGGVYGNSNQPFNENAPIVPPGRLGNYLGSKACGEILVQSYSGEFDVIVVRPFFIYGPGQKRDMLIPRLFDSVINGKPIILHGNDGIRINPIHVDDAAYAITAAIELQKSSLFNIGGPDVLTIRQICEDIGIYLNIIPKFERHCGEPNDLIGDIGGMRKFLHNPIRKLQMSLDDVVKK